MLARSYLLSLMAVVAALGPAVMAMPQNEEAQPPESAFDAVSVELDSLSADSTPVEGADVDALLRTAPELNSVIDAPALPGGVTKRDVGGLEKRTQCRPGVHWFVWSHFSKKFCDITFKNPKAAYYLREGRCLTGKVLPKKPWWGLRLNFKCCAKQCGHHISFVAASNKICKDSFRSAINHGLKTCRPLIRSADNKHDHKAPLVCSFWAS